jgi:hypothetical protein
MMAAIEKLRERHAEMSEDIENPTCGTLRACAEHKKPINLCRYCWPQWLKYLGNLCMEALAPKVKTA